jgi:hypothetical protein
MDLGVHLDVHGPAVHGSLGVEAVRVWGSGLRN